MEKWNDLEVSSQFNNISAGAATMHKYINLTQRYKLAEVWPWVTWLESFILWLDTWLEIFFKDFDLTFELHTNDSGLDMDFTWRLDF